MTSNPFDEFRARYENDWLLLCREVLNITPDPEQADVLLDIQRGERRISIRSGHGRGKTTTLAVAIVCQTLVRFPQRTVATAPTSAQLFDVLAADTKALFRSLPQAWQDVFEIKSESITHRASPEKSYVVFKTSRSETPEAMAGVHMDEGWVLLIGDEASGIPEAVFTAGHGSMSGKNCTTVLAGNPVRTAGLFYDTHHTLARGSRTDGGGWKTYHWSCFKTEGVLHPRITQDFVDEAGERYGIGTNDYLVRVLGEFPRAEADAIISYELLQAALHREVACANVRPIWGVDPARMGADRSALAKRKGNHLLENVKTWKDLDLMQLVGRIKHEWDTSPTDRRPELICVDSIGMGAGVVDRLNELGLPVRGVNVSETSALSSDQYLNLKVELYYRAEQWFRERQCTLNGDARLAAQLGWAHRDYTSSGKMKVKDTGKYSPDRGEAFLMTFADMAAAAIYGTSGGTTSWKHPLQREIKCIV